MLKSKIKILFAAAFAAIALLATSCKTEPSSWHSIQISSVTFKSSDTAPDISSTTFTVDTLNYLVYNSDSLLFSSKLTKVLPVVTCYSTPSQILINGTAWNQTDTLDLSAGTATITIIGSDNSTTCDYTLNINKHKVDPDSIVWSKYNDNFIDFTGVSDISGITANSTFYIFTKTSAGGSVYSSANGSEWTKLADYATSINTHSINLYRTQLFTTTYSYNDAIVALSDEDNPSLYIWSSEDNTWNLITAQIEDYVFTDILGSTNNELTLISKNSSTGLLHLVAYDGTDISINETATYETLPVYGSAKLHHDNVPYLIGGYSATSELLGTVYSSEDGDYWTNIATPKSSNPFGQRAYSAVFYLDGKIFLLGGQNANSSLDLYYSQDNGFNWTASSSNQKTFGDYATLYKATAFVSSDENIWLAGGFDANGSLNTSLWKGRINKSDFLIR